MNGKSRTRPTPMEVEALNPSAENGRVSGAPHQRPPHVCVQICTLIRLYIEVYPKVFGVVFVVLFSFIFVSILDKMRSPMSRHVIEHDYTNLDMHYAFKASQIDHWCLFGGDETCLCEDFTDPVARDQSEAWMAVHKRNKIAAAQPTYDSYDVVIIGDELAEMWHGTKLAAPWGGQDGQRLRKFWVKHFNRTDNVDSDFSGLALGIAGDSTSNLLWRMHHGEIPVSLESKVWWIMIGGNDLSVGGCSEDVTVLGMLRIAEEISNYHPDSVVVLQGILPQTVRKDGSLEPRAPHTSIFRPMSEEERAEQARKQALLWPSIENINNQIREFCENHEHIVYFEVDKVFIQEKGKKKYINSALMPDYRTPSFEGMKELGNAIYEELHRIIWDDNEENDIEDGSENAPV